MGQTNLALLVAVLSVATTFVTLGGPLLKSRGPDIQIIYENTDGDTISFLARNDGRSSGTVRMLALRFTPPSERLPVDVRRDIERTGIASSIKHDEMVIAPDREETVRITLSSDVANDIMRTLETIGYQSRPPVTAPGPNEPKLPFQMQVASRKRELFVELLRMKCEIEAQVTGFYLRSYDPILARIPCPSVKGLYGFLARREELFE